jgi:heptosyltransferase-2
MAKNILIRMPNWLGDAVMATPAVDTIIRANPDAKLYILSSKGVCEMFKHDSRFTEVLVDITKKSRFRLGGIKEFADVINKKYPPFDEIYVLTNSFGSTLLCRFIRAGKRIGAKAGLRNILLSKSIEIDKAAHQAVKYNQIVNGYLGTTDETGKTSLQISEAVTYPRPTVGIAPGAAYGGAKRWEAHKFAEVALKLSLTHDIVILGSPNEEAIARKIEEVLRFNNVINYQNLVGKTTLYMLLGHIAGLHLFICNDSGPMHIAGALGVPTVTVFGPTNFKQTYQWGNEKFRLIRDEIECAPCMKRECPLRHHNCMKNVSAKQVLDAAKELLG